MQDKNSYNSKIKYTNKDNKRNKNHNLYNKQKNQKLGTEKKQNLIYAYYKQKLYLTKIILKKQI